MAVLVTGASGFLGAPLVEKLLQNGERVVAIARSPMPEKFADQIKLRWIQKDLLKISLTTDELEEVKTVFHLAAIKDIGANESESEFIKQNEEMTVKLMEACSGKIEKFIFASSQMVYGDPGHLDVDEHFSLNGPETSGYACSKVNAENWLRFLQKKNGVSVISLRFCGFVEGGGAIDYMIDCALKNSPIELLSKGEVARDYLTVEDSVNAFMAAAKLEQVNGYEVFNIGSGEKLSTLEMARSVCETLKSKSEILLLEKKAPRKDFVFNIIKAKKILNFHPKGLRESIETYAMKKVNRK